MSKKLKKLLEAHLIAVEERLSDFEMRIFNAIEAIRQHVQPATESKTKGKKEKVEKAAAETVSSVEVAVEKAESAPAAEKTGKKAKTEKVAEKPAKDPAAPKRPYVKKPKDESGKPIVEPEYPADDLRSIKGIGAALAEKLSSFGVKNVYDLANIEEGTVEQLTEQVPLFAARFAKQLWREQAQSIVANLQNNSDNSGE